MQYYYTDRSSVVVGACIVGVELMCLVFFKCEVSGWPCEKCYKKACINKISVRKSKTMAAQPGKKLDNLTKS